MGSRGQSPWDALVLRAFGVSGLGYFEDLPTHLKPTKWLKITISIVYLLHATTFSQIIQNLTARSLLKCLKILLYNIIQNCNLKVSWNLKSFYKQKPTNSDFLFKVLSL